MSMHIEAVAIPVDRQVIRGNLYKPGSEARPVAVLFLHGWAGHPNDNAAKVLVEHGFYALTIGVRGHAKSDGDINRVSRQDSLQDVAVAYDFLAAQAPKGMPIVVVGSSYGSYMALLLSTIRPVAALSLRVPAAYPDKRFTEPQMGQGNEDPEVMRWRRTPQSYEGNRGFEAMHAFDGPVQIIEAEDDEQIPHQTVENYKAAIADSAQLDFHFMAGWPHSMGDDPERNRQFQELLLDWLGTIDTKQ